MRQHLNTLPVRIFWSVRTRVGYITRRDAHAVLAAIGLPRQHIFDAAVELDRVGAGQQRVVRGQQRIHAVGQPRHAGEIHRFAAHAVEFFLRVGWREAARIAGQNGVGVFVGEDVARAAWADGKLIGLKVAATRQIYPGTGLHIHRSARYADRFACQIVLCDLAGRHKGGVKINHPFAAILHFTKRQHATRCRRDRSQTARCKRQRLARLEIELPQRCPDIAVLHNMLRRNRQAAQCGQWLHRGRGIAGETDRFAGGENLRLGVAGGCHHCPMKRQISSGFQLTGRSHGAGRRATQTDGFCTRQFGTRHAAQFKFPDQIEQPRVERQRAAIGGRRSRCAATRIEIANPQGVGGKRTVAACGEYRSCVQRQLAQRQCAPGTHVKPVIQHNHIAAGQPDAVEPRLLDAASVEPGDAIGQTRRHAGR